MNLTENFTLEEMILSEYAARNGIDNTPPPEHIENLKILCQKVLQPLRDILKRPVIVSSGYRCKALNTGIGGSKTSQHIRGQAADIIVPGVRVIELFQIIGRTLNYDQVIEEFGAWVHVSYDTNYNNLRFERLVARSVNGKTVYNHYT